MPYGGRQYSMCNVQNQNKYKKKIHYKRGGGVGSIYKAAADEVGTAFQSRQQHDGYLRGPIRETITHHLAIAHTRSPAQTNVSLPTIDTPQTINYRRRNQLCAETNPRQITRNKWLRKRTSIRTPTDWTH